MYNKKQVSALFEREAVLIGSEDVIPIVRAEEIFGEAAVEFVLEFSNCNCGSRLSSAYNGVFGLGDKRGGYHCRYLTRKGFAIAATFANIQKIQAMEGE